MNIRLYKYALLVIIILWCKVGFLNSQSTYNYIVSRVHNGESYNPTLTYYDGLGRPIQVIDVAGSPGMNDLIMHIEYDAYGRENRKYLPYVSDTSSRVLHSSAASEQLSFYTASDTTIARDSIPWSETIFEASPLNRVLKQGAAGLIWQPEESGADHAMHFNYGTNGEDEVIMFIVSTDDQLVSTGYYGAGTLNKNEVRDENEVWSSEYKDLLGQVVLKVSDSDSLQAKTYYVYDDLGLLRYVIPPKAAVSLTSVDTLDTSDSLIDSLCYYYEYDARKRMSVKKLPGVEPVYMVYDKRDRLVMTQDGNLRDSTQWLFTKYDRLNRPVLTGLHKHDFAITLDSMQSLIDTIMTAYYEDLTGNDTSINFGYTNQSFPVLDGAFDEILTVTYYDNYDFDADSYVTKFSENHDEEDYPLSSINYEVKGQVTGTLVKVLGEDRYLLSVPYYDDKYRVLRVYNETLLGGIEFTLNKYDFIGNLLKTKFINKKVSTSVPVTITRWYDYDHKYRLTNVYHEIMDENTVHVSQMTYNEIGQLLIKQLHETTEDNYLQDIDYLYNIRGWLTGINDTSALGDDLFFLSLQYNDVTGIESLGAIPQYNGNISGIMWKQADEDLKGYGFSYDALNRLKTSSYGQGSGLTQETGKFNESVGSYDLNGNILGLFRSGVWGTTTYSDFDILNYYYQGNMLIAVEDQGQPDYGFIDGHEYPSELEYAYDSNGNMIKDLNKGIDAIKYNYLNLPSEVIQDATHKVMYTYDATGAKLKKSLISDGNITDRYYTGTYEYDKDSLPVLIHFDEGVINVSGSTYDYEYFLKDHLGNIRASFKPSGDNLISTQKVDYYPFGMIAYTNGASNNKYLYNGKELQDEQIGGVNLDWYDYGARFYDAQIGRWHVQDRFAEKYISLTPYQYGANNPLLFVDINGDTTYRFNDNGVYLGMFDLDQTGIRGAIGRNKTYEDKDGNKQSKFITEMNFNFNDPSVDKEQLNLMEVGKQGIQIVTEENINDIMNKSGIESKGLLGRYFFAATESGGNRDIGKGNNMDFGIKYLGGKSGGGNNDTYGGFFIFGNQSIAYNAMDGGNWLWGQGMNRLGFDYSTAQFSSQANEWFKDPKGDQNAIVKGYHYIIKTNNAAAFILKNAQY